jgi:hypothetical protein
LLWSHQSRIDLIFNINLQKQSVKACCAVLCCAVLCYAVLCRCRDVDQLEAAMDSTDAQHLISAVAALQTATAAGSAASANATAAQRSGRRGVAARKAAVAAEKAAAETAAAGREMTHEEAAAKAQVGISHSFLCLFMFGKGVC